MKPKWTEQQKTEALEMARATSMPKAAQLTGIPEGTLKRWRNEEAKRSDHIKPIRSEPVKQTTQSGNELTEKQKAFVQEYLVDLNAKAAAIRAGYSERTAAEQGHQQLQKPLVKAAIEKAMELRSFRTQITADMVLEHWWKIATADPNEIIHLRRVCCRHCYGVGHQYQWRDEDEYQQSVQTAMAAAEKTEDKSTVMIPSDAGGYGYDRIKKPYQRCPYCRGEGHQEVHIEDTRDLGPKARLLYSGIKQTNTGIEIKFRDQDKAMENVAKHLGMFVERHEHTGKDGKPIEVTNHDQLSDDELDKLITERLTALGKAGVSSLN